MSVDAFYDPMVSPLPGLDAGCASRRVAGDLGHGDLVDVIRGVSGSTAVVVADVTGPRPSASRSAGLAKQALRGAASLGLDARACVRALNGLCLANGATAGGDELFVRLFYAIIAPDRRSLTYISAGHEAAYLFAPLRDQKLPATGPIIGLMDGDAGFEQSVVQVRPGDVIVAVTGGFCEARDPRGCFLDADAVIAIVHRNAMRSAARIAEAIVEHADVYSGRALRDDVAALVLKVVA